MHYIEQFIVNFWNIVNEISFYILLGLLFAGLMKKLLPESFIKRHIGKDSYTTIFKTAMIGVPLPLCSCSVIPFASALKKAGASKSALQTFLISAPISGVDSLLVTQGALGWFFALYRMVTSFMIALVAGLFSKWFDHSVQTSAPMRFSIHKPKANPTPCHTSKPLSNHNSLKQIWDYAYHSIFSDIAKPLLIGLILASLLSTIIPTKMDNIFTQNLFLSYTLMIVLAMPLYVCATSSVPLGLSLIIAGFSPGTAFVFLSAGPATSIITMSVIKKIIGTKGLIIYLGSILTSSFIFAYIMDTFFKDFISIVVMENINQEFSLLRIASSLILLVLLYRTLIPKKSSKSCCCG
ncbi:MAG: SO_0444 family Cu/Zn efflux transporter [Sulfurospirillaceae bacterium]|nr:SO_0444 family Cu/Zn efflux transporter [Sulfurospirillaceae bacterium]